MTAESISAWVLEVEERASKKGFAFTDHTELFLQLEGNDCNYYFVDHGVRTLFWLDAYDTSDLGILPVVSSSHLSKPDLFGLFHGILILYLRNPARSSILDSYRKFLHAHWWSSSQDNRRPHWYFLSCSSRYANSNLLYHIQTSRRPITIDNLTSTQSTFPYNSMDCEKFRSLLISSRGKGNSKFLHCLSLTQIYLERINDGCTVSLIGRLWSIISKSGCAPR